MPPNTPSEFLSIVNPTVDVSHFSSAKVVRDIEYNTLIPFHPDLENKINVSYGQIHDAVERLMPLISSTRPDVMISLNGGGHFVSFLLQQRLGRSVPILPVTVSMKHDFISNENTFRVEQWFDESSSDGLRVNGGKVLFVIDSEETPGLVEFVKREVLSRYMPYDISVAMLYKSSCFKSEDVNVFHARTVSSNDEICYPWDVYLDNCQEQCEDECEKVESIDATQLKSFLKDESCEKVSTEVEKLETQDFHSNYWEESRNEGNETEKIKNEQSDTNDSSNYWYDRPKDGDNIEMVDKVQTNDYHNYWDENPHDGNNSEDKQCDNYWDEKQNDDNKPEDSNAMNEKQISESETGQCDNYWDENPNENRVEQSNLIDEKITSGSKSKESYDNYWDERPQAYDEVNVCQNYWDERPENVQNVSDHNNYWDEKPEDDGHEVSDHGYYWDEKPVSNDINSSYLNTVTDNGYGSSTCDNERMMLKSYYLNMMKTNNISNSSITEKTENIIPINCCSSLLANNENCTKETEEDSIRSEQNKIVVESSNQSYWDEKCYDTRCCEENNSQHTESYWDM